MNADPSTTIDSIGPWRAERGGGASRWLPIGTRSSGVLATVDPAGLVGLRDAGWSLDWWVGADDRWYLPARETAVRQTLVDRSPVVETRQRIPGGDLVHRVHAAQGGPGLDDREVVVIEMTNETPIPVAVAVAVRPYGVGADGAVRRIDPLEETGLAVDGAWTVLADREARRAAVGDRAHDPVLEVTSGAATDSWTTVTDDDGQASMALVFPLPHTATMRVVLMAGPPPEDRVAAVSALPGPDVVASGWARQADHGLRAVFPEPGLTDALDVTRRRLLLGAPDGPAMAEATERATVARALSLLGHHDDLRPMVGELLERQRLTGAVPDDVGSESATGATLALLGTWWRHDPRPDLLDELVGPVAKAAHRIQRRRSVRRHRRDPRRVGLLPAGAQPGELGRPFMAYLDDWWSVGGLLEASALIAASGQHAAAADPLRFARSCLGAIRRSLDAVQPELAEAAIPAGPDRSLDEGIVGLLVALTLPGVIDAGDADVARTVELIRSDLVDDEGAVRSGVAGPAASPWLTACLASHEIMTGDGRGLDRLTRLLRAGGPTFSWPRALGAHGRDLGDVGDHPAATALVALALRSLLVVERRATGDADGAGLDILPVVPSTWVGSGIELHDAPSTFGTFGFAVRWHGDRPALLWELDPAPHASPPVITASGLAPGWSTTEPVGETLLDRPAVADAAISAVAAESESLPEPGWVDPSIASGDDESFS